MADYIKFNDFNNYSTPTSNREALNKLKEEATPRTIPAVENESTEQHIARMHEQMTANQEVKEQKNVYKAAQQNPALANKLYNIREAGKNDVPPTNAELKVDDNGNMYLKIMKQMDGGFFDFAIKDGKVVFNGKLDDAHMAEAIDFLYRRGITNFELPQGVDKDFVETFKRTQEQRAQNPANLAAAPANSATVTPVAETELLDEEKVTPKEWKNPNKSNSTGIEKDVESTKEWLGDANQMKKENLSFFVNRDILSGSTEISVYDSEDPDNYKNDGKKDKNGVVKETCAYRIKLYEKDGKLDHIGFYVPKSGKCPDPLADKLVALAKDQGANCINFPEGLSPADSGVFRLAAARAGMIPLGISINKFHANKMLSEAENNIQDEGALYKYKGRLGKHLLRLSQNDPKDPRYSLAMSLINQEKLYPLKQQLEGCLTDKLTERVNGGKAEEVIGAATTMKQLFTVISAQPNIPVEQLCEKLAPQDKEFQAELLQKLQKAGANGQTASSLNDEQMTALYDSLEAKNIEAAKKTLVDKINRNKGKDSVDTIVEREVGSASKALNVTINKGLKDKGFKDGFSTIDFGAPTFEVPANTNTNSYTSTALRRNTGPDR